MKERIYIDISVIDGCFDDEFKELSKRLFEMFYSGQYIAVVSDITLDELSKAPENVQNILLTIPENSFEVIIADTEVYQLAELYITEKAITRKFYEDALHIASATINQVSVLASWNFKHIVNLNRIRLYNAVNLKNGYHLLEIRSPREIISNDEDGNY